MISFPSLKRIRRHYLSKMLVAFSLTTLAIIVITNVFIFHREQHTLTAHLIDQGNQTATFLAHTVRLGVLAENKEQMEVPVAAALDIDQVINVAIFTLNGQQIIMRERPESGAGQGVATLVVNNGAQPVFTKPPFTPRHFEHGDYFVFWAPVVADISPPDVDELYFNVQGAATPHQEVIGLVAVSLSTALVKHHRRQILIGTVASSLFLFLLCCTTFFIILRHFTKPLGKLISEVNTFGVSSTANLDDMNVLTDTYTTMVEALSDAFETIHGMKKDLEKKVVERTEELASANKNLALREKTLTASNQRLSKTLDELKNAQAQLVQSEKMAGLGQMVAGIAHEVNNTVNFIATSLPLLRKRLEHLWEETGHGADRRPLTEEQRQMLAKQTRTLVENIEEGTRRTADIVRDLQTFSRADAADLQRHFIHEGLESTLAIMPPDFRNRIEVIRDYDPELPSVVCYPGQINQVFLNILLNAMQAIPDQGTIRIRTWHDAERVHVSIRDSGPGIPDQVFPKMFDPFFTTKEVGKGTGLGLGICYQIVDRHRGRIMVRNAKGGGAEFEIILPLHPEEEGSGEPSAGRPREKTKNIDSRPPLH